VHECVSFSICCCFVSKTYVGVGWMDRPTSRRTYYVVFSLSLLAAV
jgi:hypothetical protein